MKVRVTGAARADIVEIAQFISSDAPQRAVSYARELKAACAELKDYPERFKVVLNVPGGAIRARPHGRHRVFYKITNDEVLILRVLEGAQDYQRLLG